MYAQGSIAAVWDKKDKTRLPPAAICATEMPSNTSFAEVPMKYGIMIGCYFCINDSFMPTITIDLPDCLNVPANWNAQTFVLEKMYEAGFLLSDVESVKDSAPANTESESWFTPEERAQFRANRWRLEEELNDSQAKKNQEELYQLLLNGPIADEETIKRQDEVREHIRQWKLPW